MDAKEKLNHWKDIVGTVLYFETKLRREGKLRIMLDEDGQDVADRWVETIAKEIIKLINKNENS